MCIRDSDITRAYEDLTAASKQLIRASDVSNLNTAIEKAEKIKTDIEAGKYLPDGQEAFLEALEAAKKLDKDSPQAEVDLYKFKFNGKRSVCDKCFTHLKS